jgi:hypothetical protein
MSTERWMTTIWSDSVLEVLRRRRPQSSRRGTAWEAREIVLRSFALKHLMDWSYDERVVTGSLIYRRFCRIDAGKARRQDHGPFESASRRAALKSLLERLIAIARQAGVTTGRKLRVDTRVVEAPSTTSQTAACARTPCAS